MDVTPEILRNHIIYGSSDNTNRGYHSSSRCLNYANGGTIQRAERQEVTVIPLALNYQDTVGLFGSENHFIRVQMNLDGIALDCFEEPGWRCALISEEKPGTEEYTRADQLAVIDYEKDTLEDAEYWYDTSSEPGWDELLESPEEAADNDYQYENDLALIDKTLDTKEDQDMWFAAGNQYLRARYVTDGYVPANLLGNRVNLTKGVRIKIDLKNLKTGNQYIDSWLDIRLYNKFRNEHPYDIMYVAPKEPFYIGFHARNTRRLPYNVECMIGQTTDDLRGLEEVNNIDPRLLATN